jgi:hypothetical protein
MNLNGMLNGVPELRGFYLALGLLKASRLE